MTLSEILLQARTDLDDLVVPYLWSDADLLDGINYSVDRICESAFLLYDNETPATCGPISIPALGEYFTKDARIIEIRELRLTPVDTTISWLYPLKKRSREWLENHYSTWPTADPSKPELYCENIRKGSVRLIPAPDIACKATMIVYRYPLVKMSLSALTAEPEFEERFHKFIRYGVLSRAYLKADNETYDAKKAEEYRVLFEGSDDGRRRGDLQKAYQLKYSVELQVSETVGIHKAFAG
jgi:hypothetical protein